MADPSRSNPISTKQSRIAELARQMPEAQLYSLSNHVDEAWMLEAFRQTRKDGAVGVDGQTAEDFAEDLEANLRGLIDALKSGLYRAPPVRRVEIPKGDGRTRPLGIPTFSDKVLQRAVKMLLEPIYEEDFYDFSYGFRPGRSAHDAVKAVHDAMYACYGTCWVLDADVSSFFDTIDHKQLRDLLQLRVTDGPVVRAVGKWLRAGALDGGVVHRSDKGTPQGGVISPLLANIYLHHVLDDWWDKLALPRLSGKAWLIRYADDFVMVFSNKRDALRVKKVLAQRLARFGLTLHPEKTRLVEMTPQRSSGDRGEPQSQSFDFLGFTFHFRTSKRGLRVPAIRVAQKAMTRTLRKLRRWMRANRHRPLPVQARMLRLKLRGLFNYFGIRVHFYHHTRRQLVAIHYEVVRAWKKWLCRRSQKAGTTWERFKDLLRRYPLPRPPWIEDLKDLNARPAKR